MNVRILILGWIILLFSSCGTEGRAFKFDGKWQSLNNSSSVISIEGNGDYHHFIEGIERFKTLKGLENLKIDIQNKKDNW